jgi:folate-binding protein YgfZ
MHFGDPSGEQWALEGGRGLVDRGDLRVVEVRGPDRQAWLTSITSQVITGMGPGDARELLVLDPQGHIEHAAAVADDGTATFLTTEGDRAQALAEWLDSMRFALRVEVAVRGDLTVFGTVTPRPAPAGGGGTGAWPGWMLTWDDPWPGVTEGGTAYFRGRHPGAGLQAHLHLVRRERAGEFAAAWLGGAGAPEEAGRRRPAGLLAWEAVRVAAWRPRIGREADARAIPAELDWLRTAVHIDKGCYRGQESVARVLNLGRPPRRLVFLQLDGSMGEIPRAGARLERGGRQVGVVTSVARHAEMGPIALALVARAVPADVVFDIDGVAASQELIVPLEGRAQDSPAQRPGAGLSNPALRRPDVPGAGGSGGLGSAR